MIAIHVPCLVHGVCPDEPCSIVEPACAARLARMANPLVSLFRSMASAAVEASAIEIAPPIFEAPPVTDEPIELLAAIALISLLVWMVSDDDRTQTISAIVGVASLVGSVSAACALGAAGSYIAGQGDAPMFAKEWTEKHRPDWTVDECRSRDTNDDGYITCTMDGPPGTDPEPIECGVNRWYHGYRVSGCKPVLYSRGRR